MGRRTRPPEPGRYDEGMKRFGGLVLGLAVGLVGCSSGKLYPGSSGYSSATTTITNGGETNISSTSSEHSGPKVIGRGEVQRKEFAFKDFTKVRADGFWDVTVKIGPKLSVQVEAQPEILSVFQALVQDGELRLDTNRNFESSKPIKVFITVPKLEKLDSTGTGQVSVVGISGGAFAVDLSGSGDVNATGEANGLIAGVSGTGNLTLRGKSFGATKVDLSGSGDLEISGAVSSLDADATGTGELRVSRLAGGFVVLRHPGSGDVTLVGATPTLNLVSSSTGDAELDGLAVKSAQLDLAGSGDANVNVSDSLTVTSSGTGSVRYRGKPKTKFDLSGSGTVTSR